MLIRVNEDGSLKEVCAHPDLKRDTINKLIRESVDVPCTIYFMFPEVLGESNVHCFHLDSDSDNYGITCSSLRNYVRTFSNEILNTVRILVTY